MSVKFDVKLRWQDVFRFNMYQTYTSFQGFVSILMPIVIFVIAGITISQKAYGYGALYILGGLFVMAYVPFTLWTRARMALKKNEALASTMHFHLTERSIGVTLGDESAELPWDQVYKFISTKTQVLIYSGRMNAYIIPREQLDGCYDQLKQLAEKQLPPHRVRLKDMSIEEKV